MAASSRSPSPSASKPPPGKEITTPVFFLPATICRPPPRPSPPSPPALPSPPIPRAISGNTSRPRPKAILSASEIEMAGWDFAAPPPPPPKEPRGQVRTNERFLGLSPPATLAGGLRSRNRLLRWERPGIRPDIIRKLREIFPELRNGALTEAIVESRMRTIDQTPEIDYWRCGLADISQCERDEAVWAATREKPLPEPPLETKPSLRKRFFRSFSSSHIDLTGQLVGYDGVRMPGLF